MSLKDCVLILGGVAQVKSGFTTDDSYVVTSDQSVSFANEEADSPAADQTTEAADNMEFEVRINP